MIHWVADSACACVWVCMCVGGGGALDRKSTW